MPLVLDGSKSFRGSEVTLFKAIANHLNFDYIIREPKTPGWGNISSGMAGEMTMGLSDVAWSQMYFSIWKWQFHDVTTSYDDSQHCLMVNIFFSFPVNRGKIRCDNLPGLRVMRGQRCPRVAVGLCLPVGPITQLSR